MPDTVTQIHTIAQPVEVSVKVGLEIDSKGQKKPSVEIKTAQHMSNEVALKDLNTIIDNMVSGSLERCQATIKKAIEE